MHENLFHKQRCALNLEGVDFETPIYRVFPIERLFQFFAKNQNTLVRPSMWDDPFENMIFKQTAQLKSGQTLYFSELQNRFYGQCWTLNQDESDALWRIYSPDKKGVRVKTTLKKLWDSFYNPNYQWAMISFFIGKISYETEQEIKLFFEDPENLRAIIFDGSVAGSIQTLLVKRKEFTHENEVRLIYAGNKNNDDLSKPVYQYDLNAIELVDELLFDPRFDDYVYNAFANEFKRMGFTKTIRKSSLYQLPAFNLKLNI